MHIFSKVEGDNDKLFHEKGGKGFPYLAFMDARGKIVGKHQGNRTVATLTATGTKAEKYVEIRDQLNEGRKELKPDYLILAIELGLRTYEDAKSEARLLEAVPEEKQNRLDALLNDMHIYEIAIRAGRDAEKKKAAGKRFLEMLKQEKRPLSDKSARFFYIYLMTYARELKDYASWETAINELDDRFGENESWAKWLVSERELLAKQRDEDD